MRPGDRLDRMRIAPWLAVALALAGCSSDSSDGSGGSTPNVVDADLSPLGGERPVDPIVPSDFDPTTPTPLVIMLHGYGVSGVAEDIVLKLDKLVEERGFIYLRPDGTFDSEGHRFWNATDGCCNFDGVELDDVGYIQGLIDEARARYEVSRVVLVGHSNGGFMSHRFACDRASSVDAIASLAGMTWLDPTQCQPDAPVRVLQIHGTDDATILYEGSDGVMGLAPHPSAEATVAQWASHNGCDATAEPIEQRDYSDTTPGDETEVSAHPGCPAGAGAELWAMVGEPHIPSINDAWRRDLFDFLLEP